MSKLGKLYILSKKKLFAFLLCLTTGTNFEPGKSQLGGLGMRGYSPLFLKGTIHETISVMGLQK